MVTKLLTHSSTPQFLNAPAHFMCAIQGLFQHSINRYCQVYLDDGIIFSPNVSQHIVELKDTLFVLKKAGLKLYPAKCAFVQAKVKYLGHWFTGEGYGMDPKLRLEILRR